MMSSQSILSLKLITRSVSYRCVTSLDVSGHGKPNPVLRSLNIRRKSTYNQGNDEEDSQNWKINSDTSYNSRKNSRSARDGYHRTNNRRGSLSARDMTREMFKDVYNINVDIEENRRRSSDVIRNVLQPLKNTKVHRTMGSDPYYNRWHNKYREKRDQGDRTDPEMDEQNYVRDRRSGQYNFKSEMGNYDMHDKQRTGRYEKTRSLGTIVPRGVPLQSFGISDEEADHAKAEYVAKTAEIPTEEEAKSLEREAKKRGEALDDDECEEDTDRFFVEDTKKLNSVKKSSEGIHFSKLGVEPRLVQLLSQHGIVKPTAVQAHSIPKILQRKSVIMESETGSGKTLAYLLPLLQHVRPAHKCSLVIVVPTRELATQVYTEVLKYGVEEEHVARLVSGVDDEEATEKVLSNSSILVGTPKKLLQIIDENPDSFTEVKTVVMDEVDKLFINKNWLNRQQVIKFKDKKGNVKSFQMKQKLEKTKPTELLVSLLQYIRQGGDGMQLIGTSATVPDKFIEDLKTWVFPPNTSLIDLIPQTHTRGMIPSNIKMHHLKLPWSVGNETAATVAQLFKTFNETSVLVVIGEEHSVDGAVKELQQQGLSVQALYKEAGLNGPQLSTDFLQKFESGEIQVIVVNELAIRGVDFPFLSSMYVTCFTDINDFVHLAGRVGRRGQPGRVITLIPADNYSVSRIKYKTFLGKINSYSTSLNKTFTSKNLKWLKQMALEAKEKKGRGRC